MIHYTYRIDNLINGKYYIGKHSSDSLDDKYMGSGPLIKAAIAKYGIDNFKKTILKTFPTSEGAFEHEAQIVTMAEVNDPMCYNIQPGGKGGQKRFTEEELKERKSEYQREYTQQNKERILEYQKEYIQQNKKRISEYQKEYQKEYCQRPESKKYRKEYQKEYCQRPESKKYRKEYNQQNKERISEYQKEYNQQNKERISEYQKEYYQQNKEQHREYMKEYRRKKHEQKQYNISIS